MSKFSEALLLTFNLIGGHFFLVYFFRFAPVNGSEAEHFFEKMAYIEERFYESVKIMYS